VFESLQRHSSGKSAHPDVGVMSCDTERMDLFVRIKGKELQEEN
jgi:hypothetical protein